MNANFENVLIAKETVAGTFVTPTKTYSVKSSNINTRNELQELSQVEGTIFSPTTMIQGKKSLTGNLDSYANTEILGTLLAGALGDPVTTNSGAVYTHNYDVNTYGLPTYTVETTKGTTINRGSGVKVNTLTITNEDSAINVSADLVGLKAIDSEKIINVTGVDPYTVSFSNEVFFKTTDTVEIYSSNGTLLESNVPVTVIDSEKSITIDPVTTTVNPGMILSLSKRTPSTTADKKPLRFYGDTTVKIESGTPDEKEINILDLNLSVNNNIKVDEGYRSGSYYSQRNEQGMRTLEGSFTIYSEDLPAFVASHKEGVELNVNLILEGDSIDGTTNKSLEIEGLIMITDVPVGITAGETISSSVSFKFTNVSTFKLVDGTASY